MMLTCPYPKSLLRLIVRYTPWWIEATWYRARPRPRTRPLPLSARLSARKFARTTVHTERGNSSCDSRNVCCCHAPSHENRITRLRHRFWWHFGILPLHTEEEKEEEIQAYICTPDFTEVSYLKPNTLFFSASLKSRRPLRYKIGCFSTSTISSSVLSDMLLTGALQSQIFYAYRVSPGPSYTKTKELIGWQEIVRVTIA